MPVVLKGYLDTVRALRRVNPDLYKEMNREIRSALQEVVTDGKSRVPATIPGLSQWSEPNKYFGAQNFPKWNSAVVRRGIQYSTKASSVNRSGYKVMYSLLNRSHAGAIAETAGNMGAGGQLWVGSGVDKTFQNRKQSHSNNPNAGRHFIESIDREIGPTRRIGAEKKNRRGRILIAAYEAQQGRTIDKVMAAIRKAETRANAVTSRSVGIAA
jgi:hypothetical protein